MAARAEKLSKRDDRRREKITNDIDGQNSGITVDAMQAVYSRINYRFMGMAYVKR